MNLKRIFGGLLTVLGIGSLIYAAVLFVNNSSARVILKRLSFMVYSVLYSSLPVLAWYAQQKTNH